MSFQGSLKELRLPDIIQLVSVTGKTGAFHMKKGSETGRIYLQKGTIVDADYREMRGEQALYALAVWNEGSFNFVPEAAAKERTINKSNTTLLMEAAKRLDEWRILARKVPSTSMIPRFIIPDQPTRQINLNTREWMVVSKIDEDRSIEDISEVCNLPVFDVSKVLYGLISSNLVKLDKGSAKDKESAGKSSGTEPSAKNLNSMVDKMKKVATEILGEIGEPVIAKQHSKARAEIKKGAGLAAVVEACGQITKASSVLRGPSATKLLIEQLEAIYSK